VAPRVVAHTAAQHKEYVPPRLPRLEKHSAFGQLEIIDRRAEHVSLLRTEPIGLQQILEEVGSPLRRLIERCGKRTRRPKAHRAGRSHVADLLVEGGAAESAHELERYLRVREGKAPHLAHEHVRKQTRLAATNAPGAGGARRLPQDKLAQQRAARSDTTAVGHEATTEHEAKPAAHFSALGNRLLAVETCDRHALGEHEQLRLVQLAEIRIEGDDGGKEALPLTRGDLAAQIR